MELEEEGKLIVILSSSDGEEANDDLILGIVEKARRREEMRKKERDLRKSEWKSLPSDAVVDLTTLSSSDDAEFATKDGDSLVRDPDKKKKKKKKNKKKKKKKLTGTDQKREEKYVIGVADNVVNVDKPLESVESTITEAIRTSNNLCLQKLNPGHRYLDPPTCNNCGKEGHTIGNCTEEKQKKPCSVCGKFGHGSNRCSQVGHRYFNPPTCNNCGEEGHNIWNCPEEKRKKPCFLCGKFGHEAKQCTQGQDCYICKRRGHIAKYCLDKQKESSQSSKICLRCGDLGHDMFSCQNDYALKDLKEIQCYVCKNFGHLCCANVVDDGPREVSCYNCGLSGHTGLGCAKACHEARTVSSPTLCFRCGEEGHFARGCTKSRKSGDDRGELKGKRKVNVWISPTMPGRNGQTASWHISGSESPSKKHRVLSGTSNSNVSPRPNWHNFSASRFSNTWSHFGRTW